VLVVRKIGSAPIGPEDGLYITALKNEAIDRGLTNDRVYHYGVFALYRAADGRMIPSHGVFVSAMPSPPVVTIVEPTLGRTGGAPVREGPGRISRGAAPLGRRRPQRRVGHGGGRRIPADRVLHPRLARGRGGGLARRGRPRRGRGRARGPLAGAGTVGEDGGPR